MKQKNKTKQNKHTTKKRWIYGSIFKIGSSKKLKGTWLLCDCIIGICSLNVLKNIKTRKKRIYFVRCSEVGGTNTIFEIQKKVSLINFVELEQETRNPSKNVTYFIISDLFQDKV